MRIVVPSPNRPSRRHRAARRLVAGLVLVVAAGFMPAGTVSAAGPKGGAGLHPTIHYDEARAHANDDIDFAPGGRVTVPFRPRKTDRWKVDGAAPRSLPAGRATGRAMRESGDGSGGGPKASPSPDPAVDQPQVDPATVIPAEGTSWEAAPSGGEIDLAAAVDPGALRREVFGFLPYWELSDSSTRLDWEKISTVAYFGVGTDSKGNLLKKASDGSTTVGWSGWTSSRMTSVINAAHQSGARVVLTVQSFAWSSTGLARQKALLGSSTARANLASQIAKAVRDRGADGVNLDFEPLASGYADEFTALVRKVRSTLKAIAPGYQLTFDTTGWIGNYPIEDATAPGGADAIMIMGYDYRSSGAAVAGSIAPLRSGIYDITETLNAYLARVPASKLILGVPYYGRAWSTRTDELHSENISGTKYGASATAVYTTARELAAEHGRRYDPTEGVSWTAYERETCTATYGCVTAWRQLYYDDATALKAKYDLVNARGLRGVGLWALGYDGTRTELYQALKDKFITDTVPPAITAASLTADVFSPDADGRLDTATASLTASAFIKWGYRIEVLDGTTVGASVRSGTVANKSPRLTWNGRHHDGSVVPDGRYQITLWVGDASDNRSERSFAVTVDTRPARVTSSATYAYFSPDGNGHNDTSKLAWTSSEAITGAVRILDRDARQVRSWKITDRASWGTTWDGRGGDGAVVPDGRYAYRVDGRDRAGNRTVVVRTVLVDRTIKSHRWSVASFDPRARETSRMTVSLRRSARVTATISLGSTVVRRIWTDRALGAGSWGWTWNGRTAAGAYVKPGEYRVVVQATSKHGTTRWTKYLTVETH